MNCNQLTVTSFIAVEDCELSEIHLNDTHQMQQIIDLYGADSTEMTHLFTGLSSENRVALHLSVSALNNGDIRVDGHIQLTTGQENGWQAVEGETLFSVFVPKDRVVSRTLSVVRNHTLFSSTSWRLYRYKPWRSIAKRLRYSIRVRSLL